MSTAEPRALDVTVVVDVANVMGSRPDGWWRDRAAGATRVMERLPELVGRVVDGPGDDARTQLRIQRVVAVTEGAAKAAPAVPGIELVPAPHDGDGAIVDAARDLGDAGERVLVVTADRGLRARLGDEVMVAGPGWLNDLIGR